MSDLLGAIDSGAFDVPMTGAGFITDPSEAPMTRRRRQAVDAVSADLPAKPSSSSSCGCKDKKKTALMVAGGAVVGALGYRFLFGR